MSNDVSSMYSRGPEEQAAQTYQEPEKPALSKNELAKLKEEVTHKLSLAVSGQSVDISAEEAPFVYSIVDALPDEFKDSYLNDFLSRCAHNRWRQNPGDFVYVHSLDEKGEMKEDSLTDFFWKSIDPSVRMKFYLNISKEEAEQWWKMKTDQTIVIGDRRSAPLVKLKMGE